MYLKAPPLKKYRTYIIVKKEGLAIPRKCMCNNVDMCLFLLSRDMGDCKIRISRFEAEGAGPRFEKESFRSAAASSSSGNAGVYRNDNKIQASTVKFQYVE